MLTGHEDSLVFHEFTQRYTDPTRVNWVISSPNTNWIPNPPAPSRTLRLRTDGRFGYDDPLNWPQPALPHHEYLACIPTPEYDAESRTWHTRLGIDDVVTIAGETSAFKLSSSWTRGLESARAHLCERVSRFRSSAGSTLRTPLETLFQNYNRSFLLLCETVEERRFVQYRWATFSRWALEIIAYIDYYTIFLPRLSQRQWHPVERTRMGCITLTSELTQEFFRMGIPVWTIRLLSSPGLFRSKMLYRTEPTKHSKVVDSAMAPGHSVMLEIDAWSPKYLGPVHDWARHTPLSGRPQVDDQLPLEAVKVQQPRKRKALDEGLVSSQAKRVAIRGKGEKPSKRAPAPMVLASDAISPEQRRLCFPEISDGWQVGLKDVKDREMEVKTFYYPDPEMFRSVHTMDRLRKYAAAWLAIRPLWLSYPKDCIRRPEVSTTRRWKSVFMGYFTKGGDLVNRDTKTSRERLELLDVLGIQEITPIDPENFEFEWMGDTIHGAIEKTITPSLIRKIVFELHELNFRRDFLSLHRMYDHDPSLPEQQEHLAEAFPRVGDGDLDTLPMDDELGLNDPRVIVRADALVKLNRVMFWPEQQVSEWDFPLGALYSATLAVKCENAIAASYCHKFWECTHRMPVPPALWK